MDDVTLEELKRLCKKAHDESEKGVYDSSVNKFSKTVAAFNNILRRLGGKQQVADMVKDWVGAMEGQFYTKDLHLELGLMSREDKKAANMALLRLADDGIVASCNGKRGCYRPVNTTKEILDWESADITDTVNLVWPMGLETCFNIYPTNIIILAGEKNAGKTAFLMHLAYLNSGLRPIHYHSSEMYSQELAGRIALFPNREPFRQVVFANAGCKELCDMVEPDDVNIFDFMELTDDFWKISGKIRRVFDKLRKGIAIIAIQKKPGETLGRGGAFSSEKARVYMSLTKRMLRLEVVKNWRGKTNPNGRAFPFHLSNGSLFELVRRDDIANLGE